MLYNIDAPPGVLNQMRRGSPARRSQLWTGRFLFSPLGQLLIRRSQRQWNCIRQKILLLIDGQTLSRLFFYKAPLPTCPFRL